MRAALIGLGGRIQALYPHAFKAAGLELVCACGSPEREHAPEAGLPPETKVFPYSGALFSQAEKLDLAVVCCAPHARVKEILHCLENRVHVLCEAPLCASSSEFETLRAAAAERDLRLGVLQPWEKTAAWTTLEKALDGALLGPLLWAQAQLLREGPAPDGGVTAADGCQAFAMLLAAVRLAPEALCARLTPTAQKDAPWADAAASFLVHFSGCDGAVHLAAGAHAGRARLSAAGAKGRLDLDGDTLRLDVAGLPPEVVKLRDSLCGAQTRPELLAAEMLDFVREIKQELPAGSSLRNARHCVKLLKNAHYSASLRSSTVPL
ncbi:MAG: Gfo/Idh/MocA family oxidoreductase [Elusimicrobiales bacterium]|nr:Gfo/Idh/MocA family oxidoreductase [Elusimicrobiales bacterium]